MKSRHDAKTRLEHYKVVLRLAHKNFPAGDYHVCYNLIFLNPCGEYNIQHDYPEFYKFKPYDKRNLDSWFLTNEMRIRALKMCITELTDKIYRNELD
jgi:hypothetical protein